MEKEETGKNETPKNNLIDLTIFFESLIFSTNITPEDGSISANDLLVEVTDLEPETQQILGKLLTERIHNPLVKMLRLLEEDGNMDAAKELTKEKAKETKKTIYRTVVHPENPDPSPKDPLISLQNDINDLSRLINELFLHNNAIADPKKILYVNMIVSAIINNLISFDVNPLLILLSEEVAYYINSNFLQAIIKSLSEEEEYTSELQMLKDSDQLHHKILNIIINKDKKYLKSLVEQYSEDVDITINAMLNMAIQYGAHFMAKFALEQWRLYFKTHDLSEQSYRELVSLVGHALIRSNTQICLLLTQPEMWTLYREEDQLRLLELVIYRTGNKNDKSTRKILISNMKANGFLNLELYQKIPAKTKYQRKIIKAILDEYHAEFLAKEAASELLAEELEEKENPKKSKKKSKEIKDIEKTDVKGSSLVTVPIETQDQEEVLDKSSKKKGSRKRKKPKLQKTQDVRIPDKVEAPQDTSTEEPKLVNGEEEKKEEPSEESTSFNSSTPTQKIAKPDFPLSIAHPNRDMKVINGVVVVIERCPITGEISQRFFDKDSGLEIIPTPGPSNRSGDKETTPTASTETNKAGETKADLAGGKKLAADNNSQSSYSLTAKVVVEFNLSLSSSLIYEEVENTEQNEYKESIEQVKQRSKDQSANIQYKNITTEQEDSLFGNLHNNSFIPLLPSDKEAGKVLGMIEYHNDLGNIAM